MSTKKRKKFNKEVGDFVTTTIILLVINFLSSPSYLWCLWVVGFWGAALLGKYVNFKMDDQLDAEDLNEHLDLDNYPEHTQTYKSWREKDLV